MATYNYRGAWDPNLVYQPTTSSVGPDEVYWLGAKWVSTYYTLDSNPAYKTGWSLVEGTPRYDPAVPAPLAASQIVLASFTDRSLTLSWDQALVPGAGEVSSYNVFVNGAKVGVTTGTTFTITNLSAATTYSVSISSTDAYGTSGPDSVLSQSSTPVELNVAKGPNPVVTFTTDTAHTSTGKYYSPFIDVGLPNYDLLAINKSSGITNFTLAFQQALKSDLNTDNLTQNSYGYTYVLKPGAIPTMGFGGLSAVTTPTGALINEITQIQRSEGGTVTVSIGGYTGIDPAVVAAQYSAYLQTSAGGGLTATAANAKAALQLQAEFQSVMNTFGVTHLDFDIETDSFDNGAHVYKVANDVAANALRNTAIVALEAANPGMTVAFTVATNTTGLSSDVNSYSGNVLGLLQTALASGVRMDVLNIMTMDFADGVVSSESSKSIAAANAVHAQLPALKIALTPMIGQNDVASERTELADARAIETFALQTPWVVGTGIWQLGRDQAGTYTSSTTVQQYNSSVAQGQWDFSKIFQAVTSVSKASTANDLGYDGRSDLVWHGTDGSVRVWSMNGASITSDTAVTRIPTNWTVVGVGDVTGDGRADLVWESTAGEVRTWAMNGASITADRQVATGIPSDYSIQKVADFTGDGKADLLWRSSASGAVRLWTMNANGQLAADQGVTTVSTDWKIAGVGDFDGDGKADMLWRNDNGANRIWLMNGASIALDASIGNGGGSLAANWKVEAVADVNGDGKSDIIWRSTAGDVRVWLMNGSAITGDVGLSSGLSSAWTVQAAADFNGDGRSDLMWRNGSTGEVRLWTLGAAGVVADERVSLVGTDWHIVNMIPG